MQVWPLALRMLHCVVTGGPAGMKSELSTVKLCGGFQAVTVTASVLPGPKLKVMRRGVLSGPNSKLVGANQVEMPSAVAMALQARSIGPGT